MPDAIYGTDNVLAEDSSDVDWEDRWNATLGQTWVEAKATYGGEWEWYIDLEAVEAQHMAGSLGTGKAVIRYRYGPRIKAAGDADYVHLPKAATLRGWWVRIRSYLDTEPVTLWVGQIEHPLDEVKGDQVQDAGGTEQASGVQHWVAYGPLRILEKVKIARSYWGYEDTTAGEYNAVSLEWVPDFNMRHGDPGLAGNRSAELVDKFQGDPAGTHWDWAIYAFGGTEEWTTADIVDYVLRMCMNEGPDDGPRWTTGGDDWYLLDLVPRISMASVTNAAELLRRVLAPGRGLDFAVVETDDGFELRVFGLSGEELSFEGYTGLQNTWRVPLNASSEIVHEVQIERGAREQYDRLRLVGDRILTVFSVGDTGTGNLAGVLDQGWTAAEEVAYLAGSAEVDAEMDDHDRFRSDERFRFVFQRFFVPLDTFDYATGAANQVFAADGTHAAAEDYEFQRVELGTLPQLPLQAGVNYTTDPPTGRNPTGTQADYLPPLVFAYDPRTSQWVTVNKLPAVSDEYPPVEVRALEHELGVLLRSNPNHLFAYADWGGAADSKFQPAESGFDWEGLIATVAVETDHRISVEMQLPPDVATGDGTVKEIVVSLAQFWWLTGYTVVGVDDDGTLLRAPAAGVEIRNDVNLLRALMPGALARYLHERRRATVRRNGGLVPWQDLVGALLRLHGEQGELTDLDTPVTSVRWDFDRRITRMSCGQAEV